MIEKDREVIERMFDFLMDYDAIFEAFREYSETDYDEVIDARNSFKEKTWQVRHGVVTPGGDPSYECPVCHDRKSVHLNGVESICNWEYCPCCGTKLKYE